MREFMCEYGAVVAVMTMGLGVAIGMAAGWLVRKWEVEEDPWLK